MTEKKVNPLPFQNFPSSRPCQLCAFELTGKGVCACVRKTGGKKRIERGEGGEVRGNVRDEGWRRWKKKEVKTDPKSAKLSFFFSLSDGWQHAARALSITISRKKIEKSQFKSASSSFALTDRLQLLAIAKDAKCKKRVVVVAFLLQARLLPKVLKVVTFVREQKKHLLFKWRGNFSQFFF